MSAATTWLHGQRKSELIGIAEKVGLKDYDNLKKIDLETALDEHMRANQTRLSKDNALQPYYKRINPSPVKKEVSLTETKTPRARRTTKAREDLEQTTESSEPEPERSLVSRTSVENLASRVPLPPSPSVVANQIDRQAAKVRTSINDTISTLGIAERTDRLRDMLSSTPAIETLALLVELNGLRKAILPNKYLTMIPASSTLHTPEIPIKLADLFALLTSEFWVLFSMWLLTSVFLPLTCSYFFNLSLKAKYGQVRNTKYVQSAQQFDPLTYNISKALVAWLVYGQGVTFFGFNEIDSIWKLETAIPGGRQGIYVGAGIGALTSIYEAVLRK